MEKVEEMDDYNPDDELKHVQDYVPLQYKEKVIAYIDKHPKHKFETIKENLQNWKERSTYQDGDRTLTTEEIGKIN